MDQAYHHRQGVLEVLVGRVLCKVVLEALQVLGVLGGMGLCLSYMGRVEDMVVRTVGTGGTGGIGGREPGPLLLAAQPAGQLTPAPGGPLSPVDPALVARPEKR